jgi:hypothetical protein
LNFPHLREKHELTAGLPEKSIYARGARAAGIEWQQGAIDQRFLFD